MQFLAICYITINDAKPGGFDGSQYPQLQPQDVEELLSLANKHDIKDKEAGCKLFKEQPHLCPPKLKKVVTQMCSS